MKIEIRALLAMVAIFALSILMMGAMNALIDPFDDFEFDTAGWKQPKNRETAARMCRDLITNHLHSGMSRSKVQRLLSKPDEIIYSKQDRGGNSLPGIETHAYYGGSWSMYGFDDAHLYVHLRSRGTRDFIDHQWLLKANTTKGQHMALKSHRQIYETIDQG